MGSMKEKKKADQGPWLVANGGTETPFFSRNKDYNLSRSKPQQGITTMPRKIKSDFGETYTVYQHLITQNFWEYYILDNEKSDYRFALVMGYDTEMGDVSMAEISPYVITKTSSLTEVMPPPGWTWVD